MSASSAAAKSKMFGFIKNVFRKPAERPADGRDYQRSATPPPMPVNARASTLASAMAASARPVSARANGGGPAPVPAPPQVAYHGGNGHAEAYENGNGHPLCVPLQGILNALPAELKARVRQLEVGDMTVELPMESVLSQLARGQVKISFGELRQTAPHVFSPDPDRDQTLITLPLNDILVRMNPSLLVRRQNQRHIEVPDEVRSPFGDQGQGLVFSVGPGKKEVSTPSRGVTPAAPQMPPPRPAYSAPAAPAAPVPRAYAQPPAPMAPPPAPVAQPYVTRPAAPVAQPISSIAPPSAVPPGFARPVSGPAPAIPVSSALRSLAGPAAPVREAAPAPVAAPIPMTMAPARALDETACLFVPLSVLSEGWPEAMRLEIAQLGITQEQVALPADGVELGLKRGKVAFPWKLLRSWIRPAPAIAVSAHDGVILDLPLHVLAPLFLTRQKNGGKAQQKAGVDETIPNLFFGFPQSEAAPVAPSGLSHAVATPVDTNYYTRQDVPPVSDTQIMAKGGLPSTEFLRRCATPNEVVSRAAALDGVSGALIALPDGLMVASRLAPDLNPDTLAAFLPHIFGKVTQCTKELRMGELNNLNFTVGNVPWKIFRVNAIYFAAFGRANEPLPTSQLAALAAELDRKQK